MIREPSPCPGGCGRMLRPFRTTAEQWPNTVTLRTKGMCKPCGRLLLPKPPSDDDRTRYITRELVAYMRWRGRDVSQLGISA